MSPQFQVPLLLCPLVRSTALTIVVLQNPRERTSCVGNCGGSAQLRYHVTWPVSQPDVRSAILEQFSTASSQIRNPRFATIISS